MNTVIKVDAEKCSGCGACSLECSLVHHELYNPKMAGILIEKFSYGIHFPVLCQHCSEAPCVVACPTGAMHKVADGRILVRLEDCIGCEACYEACPIKAINVLDEKVYKCDLCDGDPKCVDVCLTGAITIGEDNSTYRSTENTIKARDNFLRIRNWEGGKY